PWAPLVAIRDDSWSMSASVALESQNRPSTRAIARPSCLHGVHCPHDSTDRKWATPWATATSSTEWSNTMKPAQPSPEPAARMSSYVRAVSSLLGGMNALDTPD